MKKKECYETEPVKEAEATMLEDPSLFINREMSWLRLNRRILEEAKDTSHPLLERVKFLAITGSNLDEFFMVRVAGLRKQILKGALLIPSDGMTPQQQLDAIRKEVLELLEEYERCWALELLPKMADAGISIKKMADLNEKQKNVMRKYFKDIIFPTLTPLAVDISHPFPFISNLSVNLMVIMKDKHKREKYARIKIPTRLFSRLLRVPTEENKKNEICMVFMEDLIAENLDLVFPGLEIIEAHPFRITRDADIDIAFYEAPDLLTAIEDVIEERKMGKPIRLQIGKSMPEHLQELFMKNLGLPQDMVYPWDGPMGLVDLWQLLSIERPDLKDTPFLPYTPNELSENGNILSAVSKRDYLFYHPYDNFNIIVNMLRQAASDPNVLAIKITLYRIDRNSPVIDALLTARQNGKAVTALVELKARFDEQNNINWARMMEHEGVHVVYGLVDLKVHAKICLIVRKEGEKITRYSHISSGNYNAVTSRIYGDISYLTANNEVGSDLSLLFNALTGYSQKEDYKQLIVAPKSLKKEIIRRIKREITVQKKKGSGYIGLKFNGLVDKDIIQALYRASMEGVKIELNVRGLCCLRPGMPKYSENITVNSIVGRFLEHARIYYFKNGGNEEVLIGSSDLMPRNLIKRIEVLVPVQDRRLMKAIIDYLLEPHLKDNVKSRKLLSDGSYERICPSEGEKPMNSQMWLIENRGIWHKLPRNVKKS